MVIIFEQKQQTQPLFYCKYVNEKENEDVGGEKSSSIEPVLCFRKIDAGGREYCKI